MPLLPTAQHHQMFMRHHSAIRLRRRAANLAVWLVILGVMAYASPTVNALGHGSATGMGAMLLGALCASLALGRHGIQRWFVRYRWLALCGGVFVAQAFPRLVADPVRMDLMVVAPGLTLVSLLVLGQIAELGDPYLSRVRTWFACLWCISVGLGVVTLAVEPGCSRYLTGYDTVGRRAARVQGRALHEPVRAYGARGVGGVVTYITIAVCLPAMWALARQQTGPRLRLVVPIIAATTAVLISSWTLAGLLCVLAIVLIPLVVIRTPVSLAMFCAWAVTALSVATPLWILMREGSYTGFVTQRVERLVMGALAGDIVGADKGGRTSWIIRELSEFADDPWLGQVPGALEPRFVGGHSTIVDSLNLFGIPGACFWFLLLFSLARRGVGGAATPMRRRALLVSWLLFGFASLYDPVGLSVATVCPLYVLSLPDATAAFAGSFGPSASADPVGV